MSIKQRKSKEKQVYTFVVKVFKMLVFELFGNRSLIGVLKDLLL